MHSPIETLSAFSIFALLILFASPISSLTRIPIVVVEMILGALSAHFFTFIKDIEEVSIVAEVGFLFLMFLCGLEVDIKSFLKLGNSFLLRALGYFCTLYALTCIVVFSFGISYIYIAAFPVMSLGMIVALIKDYGKEQPWLDLALKIGILGELVSIGALVIIDGASRHGVGSQLGQKLLILVLFLVFVICGFRVAKVLFWWMPKLRFLFLPRDDSNSQDLRFVFFLLFSFVLLMMILDIKAVLGAFLAGCILSTFFKHKQALPEQLNHFGFGFLVPFFFIHVGSTLDLNALFKDTQILLHASYLILGMLTLRLVSASIVFGSYFKSAKSTLLFALSDSMPLTFLIATATLGKGIGELNDTLYASFLLGAILEGIIFSIIIKLVYVLWTPKKDK
ncbi:cation:proton antiporter [Helicobacter marmotae]|uniref:Cation:proton antiporter n=1 Tax=Helicobacter marmotae TaxID=152490 RepID=A0A3D8I3U1_9HELI|nr:cation:proton antiporter [Helicobacter marmotae]RDU59798.1 cation:proton antiporter [Helicobacter marmotae]